MMQKIPKAEYTAEFREQAVKRMASASARWPRGWA
jgi:hypothetical protein